MSARGLLARAGWYGARLGAMSAAEIGHRLGEQARRAVSRFDRSPALPAGLGERELPGLPGLPDGLAALAGDAALLASWEARAQEARTGRHRLLGTDWPGRLDDGRWFVDPATGRDWPSVPYCFDVGYRHAPGMGDVKLVWELNRLQHLQPLAALARLRRDRELARFCVEEALSWIRANPPYRGVNWSSGIELALRVVSLLAAFACVGEAVRPGVEREALWGTLLAHGRWLARFPSRHSSANNHLVAEAGGLYLLGLLAPSLPGADAWREHGRATLEAEALRQFHPDGIGAEQSPTYAAFTLEWFLLALRAAERGGEPFPADATARLALAAEALRWFLDERGNPPRIGDDDEGRVLASHPEGDGYVASVVSAAAAALGRPDIAPPGRRPHLRDAVLGASARMGPEPQGVRHFLAGGYTVRRGRVGTTAYLLAMDHGPLGHLSIAAHGHADALSLWLHVGGRPVLVDAGTYLYHSGGALRDRFRGTALHGTLLLDGLDSSVPAGAFNWGHKAAARAVSTGFGPDGKVWQVTGEHDGYLRRRGVVHRRTLREEGPGRFTVEDEILGSGPPRPVEIGFLLHPEVKLRAEDGAWRARLDGGDVLALVHDGTLEARVARGDEPGGGWHSPAFGSRVPAPRLVFSGALSPGTPCRFALAVLGAEPGPTPEESTRRSEGVTSLTW